MLQNLTAKRTLHLRAKAQSRRVQNLNPPKQPQSSSSSSKADSSKNESSKPTPKPQHTHSWTNITEKVKVVDKKAYTYEEPVYEEHGRTICNDCGADLTNMSDSELTNHICEHAENGGKGSYHDEWVNVQVGTKKLMSLRKAIMRLKQSAENVRVAVK